MKPELFTELAKRIREIHDYEDDDIEGLKWEEELRDGNKLVSVQMTSITAQFYMALIKKNSFKEDKTAYYIEHLINEKTYRIVVDLKKMILQVIADFLNEVHKPGDSTWKVDEKKKTVFCTSDSLDYFFRGNKAAGAYEKICKEFSLAAKKAGFTAAVIDQFQNALQKESHKLYCAYYFDSTSSFLEKLFDLACDYKRDKVIMSPLIEKVAIKFFDHLPEDQPLRNLPLELSICIGTFFHGKEVVRLAQTNQSMRCFTKETVETLNEEHEAENLMPISPT